MTDVQGLDTFDFAQRFWKAAIGGGHDFKVRLKSGSTYYEVKNMVDSTIIYVDGPEEKQISFSECCFGFTPLS